jgi:anti-sigma factor RsiW
MAAEAAKLRPPARRLDWRSNPLVGLAAAALILISAGFIVNHYWTAPPARVATLPNDLAGEMTAAHDAALALAAHHELDVPREDLEKIRKTLKDRLGHPVLVASLGPDWKLEGARVAKIGDRNGAQLVYTRGDETVSVISVSIEGRAYYAPKDGTNYAQTWDGHPLAGVIKGGAVHCVIGSRDSKLSQKVLSRLRDKISGLIAAGETSRGGCGSRLGTVSGL